MADRYVLDGRVVTMNATFDVFDAGRIYVDGNSIVGVAAADAPAPDGFAGAPVVRTGDTIYPGLIELHNHLSYNALPLWSLPQRFENRDQWARHRDYRKYISGPASVLGRTGGFLEAVVRYVESKCLLGGVTTSQGIALASNQGIRRFYKGLVRNVEAGGDKTLPAAATRVADVAASDARKFLAELNRSSSLLLHLAEGVDAAARSHFQALQIDKKANEWAITPSLAGIHCAGLEGRDYQTFKSRGGSMVWSPQSNLLLYGGTADIARAAKAGLLISLGSDWSPSGSKNLLAELKVAWLVSQARGDVFTPQELVAMATINPARILKWQDQLGSIEAGKRADMIAVDGRTGDPYEALIKAKETSLTLVVIDGSARYGQPSLMAKLAGDSDHLEHRTVGGAERVIDLTDALEDPLVGALTLADAESRLADGMRTLPELARQLENPITAAAALGASDGTNPGVWFLELDNDEQDGLSGRHAFGAAAGSDLDLFALGAAEPLSETLIPLALDPLTVVDDDGYTDRLASSVDMSDEAKTVIRGLAKLYGRKAPAFAAAPAVAPGARGGGAPAAPPARADVALKAAGDGTAQPARLADFLDAVGDGTLTLADRLVLVDQALVMLQQCYVHLVLKRAMHAIDPVQELRLLRERLSLLTEDTRGSEVDFHREMQSIFTSLRDLHTNYMLPDPFRTRTAFLPFLLERCVDGTGGDRYVVTKVAASLTHPTFVPQVEVLVWNGTPIARAVAANARRTAGSNPAASFRRGLDAMTIRPLLRTLPPEEDWVVVTYRGLDGREREIRLDWQVAVAGPGGDNGTGLSNQAALGSDVLVEAVNRAKQDLFAPTAVDAAAEIADPRTPTLRAAVRATDLPTSMPTVFRAREVTTPSGTFGHIRIFTFNVPDAGPFVDEFVHLVDQLPGDGLILDVRGNGGGLIYAAEQLLQVLTPRQITPEPAQVTTSPLMLDMCRRNSPSPLDATFSLAPWVPSLQQALATGAQYSNAFPMTDPAAANARGQRYHGPVVLVTNGLCYSATDMFSAGFQDHGIGPVLGVDGNTGAGGANVWTHELLKAFMDVAPVGNGGTTGNPFVDLPAGADFRAAVRRTLRVGANRAGTPVEDLGIEPDARHEMTLPDLMADNVDLLAAAGALLAAAPAYRLAVEPEVRSDGRIRLRLTTGGLDRVDVAVDGRPVASVDVTDRASTHTVRPSAPSPATLDLTGWSGGQVVARLREPLAAAGRGIQRTAVSKMELSTGRPRTRSG